MICVHLVLQLKLHLLQPMFLHLLLGGEVRLGFQCLQLLMISWRARSAKRRNSSSVCIKCVFNSSCVFSIRVLSPL